MTSTAAGPPPAGPRRAPAAHRQLRAAPGAGLAPADLAPAAGSVARLRHALERAEEAFVAQVVADGGIGPWRRRVTGRFRAARDALAVSGTSRAETAALLVALLDRPVRDRCWEQLETDPDEQWLVLWRHLARHAVPPYCAEPLFLLAWTAWRLGDPGTARVAVDCARAQDPGHGASGLLEEMLTAGTDPRQLPSLAADRRSTDPAGDRSPT